MAARTKRPNHNDKTREKIKTSQIINRLYKHILGEVEMKPSQVTAALGLIKKTIPDLQAMELSGEVETTQRVINAQPMTEDEWDKRYGNDLGTAEGSTTSTH